MASLPSMEGEAPPEFADGMGDFPFAQSEEHYRSTLSKEAFRVLRKRGIILPRFSPFLIRHAYGRH